MKKQVKDKRDWLRWQKKIIREEYVMEGKNGKTYK